MHSYSPAGQNTSGGRGITDAQALASDPLCSWETSGDFIDDIGRSQGLSEFLAIYSILIDQKAKKRITSYACLIFRSRFPVSLSYPAWSKPQKFKIHLTTLGQLASNFRLPLDDLFYYEEEMSEMLSWNQCTSSKLLSFHFRRHD